MNTNLKNRLASLSADSKDKRDKLELDRELLSARFLSEIQINLDAKRISRKDFAKKMGVSGSFVSQLFSGEKVVSMEFLAKVQQEFKLRFYISTTDQSDSKGFADEITEITLNKLMEIENLNKKNQKAKEGFWIFHSKEKPNYDKLENDFIPEAQLSVA